MNILKFLSLCGTFILIGCSKGIEFQSVEKDLVSINKCLNLIRDMAPIKITSSDIWKNKKIDVETLFYEHDYVYSVIIYLNPVYDDLGVHNNDSSVIFDSRGVPPIYCTVKVNDGDVIGLAGPHSYDSKATVEYFLPNRQELEKSRKHFSSLYMRGDIYQVLVREYSFNKNLNLEMKKEYITSQRL